MSTTAVKTLSAGHELLPTLGNDLRDLSGLDTLIYELIQNADDAEGVSEMIFDVTDDALVVENDGVFSDCGTPDARECNGVVLDGARVRCDFHSFLKISGQAKRQKTGTTGAFGMGFTSVFQITDYPELLSAGRHWVLRYDEPQAQNVHVCDGCARSHQLAGTTFILPWARDPASAIRRGLGVGIPEANVARSLVDVARECVPGAMVFLRRLDRIEVRRNGRKAFECTRSEADTWTFIDDGSREQTFYVLKGDFEVAAQTLRAHYPSLLGVDVREASVTIAVLTDGDDLRLPLHAVLPTQESVPLGFRLSASFYPFQDRKRLKFESESDGESEWNRAAVRGAATLLAENAKALAEDLGPERAWSLFRAAHEVATRVEDAPDSSFSSFWEELAASLRDSEIVWTADGQWVPAANAVLLEPEWHRAIAVLQELEIAVVNPLIAPDVAIVAGKIGVQRLDLERLASAITTAGITEMRADADLPGELGKAEGLNHLLSVVADLLEVVEPSEEPLDVLNGCAVIPCGGGVVAAPEAISAEESETVRLFADLPQLFFVDVERVDAISPSLRRLLWPLQVFEVVAALSSAAEDGRLGDFLAKTEVPGVLRWVADRAGDLNDDDAATFRSLAIFPSANGLQPLDELQLPGPFTKDPLGIAATVDLTGIEDLRPFLGEEGLGAHTLSLEVYVRDRLVPAMNDGPAFDDPALDKLLAVLATNIDDLDDVVIGQLAELPLLPTSAGRRAAAQAYFDNDIVRAVLGNAPVVSLESRGLRRLKPLLELLGVTTEPRASDIVAAIEETVSKPKSRERLRRIRTIVEHLGPTYRFGTNKEREEALERLEDEFGELWKMDWMPVAGVDQWAKPEETYRTEWRAAFDSTGTFVDLPEKTVQQPNADLLDLLGVQMRPTPELVIGHLLNCARTGIAVAKRAYEALDNADADEVERLRDEPCILVERTPAVRYAIPLQVVRDVGALRRYLHALPTELAGFHDLAENLGVADHPEADHAIYVLQEIAAADSDADTPPPEQDLAAAEACWRVLESAIHGAAEDWSEHDSEDVDESDRVEQRIREELADCRTWPDGRGVLRRPSQLYIDDRPALRRFIPDAVLKMLVHRPRFGIDALAAAGLQFLSAALEQEIVRVPGARQSLELEALLRDREDAIARIVSAETGTTEPLDLLRALEILEADEILLHRSIPGDVTIELGEHPVPAYLDTSGNRLFVQSLQPPAWTEVAVEIAVLICGDQSSPAVGAAIEKVLTAGSASAAHAALDVLQIPRLATDAQVDLSEELHAGTLFDDDASALDDEPVDQTFEEDGEVADDEPDAVDEVALAIDADDVTLSDPIPYGSGNGSSAMDEDEVQSSSPAPSGGESPVVGGGGRGGSAGAAGAGVPPTEVGGTPGVGGRSGPRVDRDGRKRDGDSRREVETPWRIWVSGRRGEHQQERSESEATALLRSEVSRKGVERVLQYEKEHGRWTQEMPPNNPGFDVESRNEPGRPPTRLIEVKSLAGSWEAEWGNAGNPPQMTSEQFRLSMEEGRHWLYVVEHALDDDAWVIFPIQAVGGRANRYLIDHGWKEAADRPFGPGLGAHMPYEVSPPLVPDLDAVVFGNGERDEGDIPFLSWDEVALADDPELYAICDVWFTSPAATGETDFAVQQLEAAMGPTLPLGSVAAFRPVNGSFPDGAVVIARVGPEDEPQYAIRRAYVVRDQAGDVEGVHLRVDVPGRGDEFEFHDPAAVSRVRAVYIAHQEL